MAAGVSCFFGSSAAGFVVSNLMTFRRLSTLSFFSASGFGVWGGSGGLPAVVVSCVVIGSSFPSLSLMCTPPDSNLLGDPSHINWNRIFILLYDFFLMEKNIFMGYSEMTSILRRSHCIKRTFFFETS